MAIINQYPPDVADWATICEWVRTNRPELWDRLSPEDTDDPGNSPT